MLKQILLGFLNYASMSGYDLKTIIDNSTTHFWHAYHSQIYTTLRKLESDGLLTSEVGNDDEGKLQRRVYTITEAGRVFLRDWMHGNLQDLPQIKEELMVRVFFSGGRGVDAVVDELRHQRTLHERKLETFQQFTAQNLLSGLGLNVERMPHITEEALYWQATLDFGIRYEQMYITWLDDTIARITGEAN